MIECPNSISGPSNEMMLFPTSPEAHLLSLETFVCTRAASAVGPDGKVG